MRVNARLDPVDEERLRYLMEHTGKNVSDILKDSVANLYEQVRARQAKPFDLMQELGIVGRFEGGDPLASESVDEVLAAALERKLGRG